MAYQPIWGELVVIALKAVNTIELIFFLLKKY
jgi:hypothetical protein